MKKIILGSASPRRRELLEQIGIEFEVKISSREEIYTATEPEAIVKELALEKASHVSEDIRESKEAWKKMLVIGADTVVVLDGKILGKAERRGGCISDALSASGAYASGVHRSGDAGL